MRGLLTIIHAVFLQIVCQLCIPFTKLFILHKVHNTVI